MNNDFWNGKRVFVTSPASFLGAWLVQVLLEHKAQVFGYGESAAHTPNLFDLRNFGQKIAMTYGDLRDESSLREALNFAQADVVIHLGESGLMQEHERRALETFAKATLGSATLMELLRETASVRSVVVVSSDKVYQRKKESSPYVESDAVGPSGILPTAKLCSEMIALSYRATFFAPEKYNKHKVAIATARLGAPIGGGDFTPMGFIPQAVQAFVAGEAFEVRNPQSMRPWIHVQDQVYGVLALAQGLYERGPKLAPTYNFGPESLHSVGEVGQSMVLAWGEKARISISEAAKSNPSVHGELNSQSALLDLGWKPQINLPNAIKDTLKWYKEFYSSPDSGNN